MIFRQLLEWFRPQSRSDEEAIDPAESEILRRLADDLEELARGKITESEIRSRYEWTRAQPRLGTVMCNLYHYLDDADIRSRDPRYREMQESELRKLLALLRGDATERELDAINFLWHSKS